MGGLKQLQLLLCRARALHQFAPNLLFPTALKMSQRPLRELKQTKGTILPLHTSLVLYLKRLILTLINLASGCYASL